MANTTVKGPASYFPAIEQAYGQPISYWLEVIAAMQPKKHMEMVNTLKTEY